MKLRNKKVYYLRRRIVQKTSGGEKYADYAEAVEISATSYSGQGQVQEGMSGDIQQYQRKLLMDDDYTVSVENGVETYHITDKSGNRFSMAAGDGICLYASPEQKPDYKIMSIIAAGHLKIMLGRL